MENQTQKPISEMLGITMEKIKEMVDINSIIGEPIKIDESITIIPISKVSFGFASGGSDLPTKLSKDLFGGGAGAGVSIKPEGFLVISDGEVQMIPVSGTSDPISAAIGSIPSVINKITDMVKKKKDNSDNSNINSDNDNAENDEIYDEIV